MHQFNITISPFHSITTVYRPFLEWSKPLKAPLREVSIDTHFETFLLLTRNFDPKRGYELSPCVWGSSYQKGLPLTLNRSPVKLPIRFAPSTKNLHITPRLSREKGAFPFEDVSVSSSRFKRVSPNDTPLKKDISSNRPIRKWSSFLCRNYFSILSKTIFCCCVSTIFFALFRRNRVE